MRFGHVCIFKRKDKGLALQVRKAPLPPHFSRPFRHGRRGQRLRQTRGRVLQHPPRFVFQADGAGRIDEVALALGAHEPVFIRRRFAVRVLKGGRHQGASQKERVLLPLDERNAHIFFLKLKYNGDVPAERALRVP